jgi:hypothetical protein
VSVHGSRQSLHTASTFVAHFFLLLAEVLHFTSHNNSLHTASTFVAHFFLLLAEVLHFPSHNNSLHAATALSSLASLVCSSQLSFSPKVTATPSTHCATYLLHGSTGNWQVTCWLQYILNRRHAGMFRCSRCWRRTLRETSSVLFVCVCVVSIPPWIHGWMITYHRL